MKTIFSRNSLLASTCAVFTIASVFFVMGVRAARPDQTPAPAQGAARVPAPRPVPRPPAPVPNAPPSEPRSSAPDGYAPIPQWLGQTRAPHPAKKAAYDVEEFASGVRGGFSFHFLPDGRLILSERPGRMRIVDKDGRILDPIGGLPAIWALGAQGLFEVLPDRNFASNRTLYFGYTALPEGVTEKTAGRVAGILMIARARLSADDRNLEDVRVLLNAEGMGGRIIQAADGTLFATSGIPSALDINVADWPQPQQLDSNMGKLLHINTDGTIPKDNPFVGRPATKPEIYAYGFREDQGLAFHPRTGRLWQSENGPRGGDEINIIEKGKNYGFPVITYGHEYTGKPINGDKTVQEGMEQPVYYWTPSIALSGMTFYTGRLFPAWQGDLFVASMAGRHIVRLVLQGERVAGEERLLTDLNTRMRDVHEGPDGALWVLTDGNAGKILRLVPKK